MLADFERWPAFKNLYIKAFDKMIANHPGQIKVASGELAPSNGGVVVPYTQSGLHGASDGDSNSDHASNNSDINCSCGEREREQDKPPLDGGGKSFFNWWCNFS